MGTLAFRSATFLCSLLLLISLLASSADSATITKTYVTTTKITANEQHVVAAARSATTNSELRSKSGETIASGEKRSPDLGLGKRVAQNHVSGSLTATTQPLSSPATIDTVSRGAESDNSSVLFTVGTHVVPFTPGEVQVIDGSTFCLDTGARSLHVTHASKSNSSVTVHGVSKPPPHDGQSTSLAATHLNSTASGEDSTKSSQQASVSTSTGSASNFSSSSSEVASSGSQSDSSTLDSIIAVPTTQSSISTASGGVASDKPSGDLAESGSQNLTQSTSTLLGSQTSKSTDGSTIVTSESESMSESSTHDISSETSHSKTVLTSDTTSAETEHGTTSDASSSVEHSSDADHASKMAATSSSTPGGSIVSAHTPKSLVSSTNSTSSATSSSSSRIPQESSTHTESSGRATAMSTSSGSIGSIVSMTRTGGFNGNDSVVLPTTPSSSSASDTRSSSFTTAHNTSISMSSATVTGSNTSWSGTSKIGSASSSSTSSLIITSSSSDRFSNVSTTDSKSRKLTSSTSPGTSSSAPGSIASPSSSSGIKSFNATSNTLPSPIAANTTQSGSSRGQQTSSIDSKSGDEPTMTSLSETSGGQSSAGQVTTPRGSNTGTTESSGPRPTTTASSKGVTTPMDTSAGSLTSSIPINSAPSTNVPQTVTFMAGEWRESAMKTSCKAPCTMTLPPIRLDPSAVLQYPPVSTSICTNVGNQIYRYVTTVSVDSMTITDLTLKPISVRTMTDGEPAATSEAGFLFPPAMCSLALPPGDPCAKRPLDSTDGTCGSQHGTGCPDMQCCGPDGTCGTTKNECAKQSGCQRDFGPCWLDGEESFRPLSDVFPPATDSSACPMAIRPTLPIDGPVITGILSEESDTPTSTESGTVLPVSTSSSKTGAVAILPPVFVGPHLCTLCPPKIKSPPWRFDLQCRGPLCDSIGPQGGGGLCKVLCNLLKCKIGCKKKGGGEISEDDKPPPDPKDPEKPTKSRECETKTATEVTALCNIVTQLQVMGKGSGSTLSAPQTTCTTKKHITQGCDVTPKTTTIFDSCTNTQTATDFTKFCTESVSAGVTYTPCTKTVSTVFEGCSISATTTIVMDEACQAKVTLAPDDPQGEFGTMPEVSSNDTCPYFPGVNDTVLDDQGSDGQNDSCPMLNGRRTNIDDDQGDDGGNQSCPMNNTIVLEPDGALDNETAPSCENPALSLDLTAEQELDEGEDGLSQQFCPMGGNDTLEVDNEQGEDGERQQDGGQQQGGGGIGWPLTHGGSGQQQQGDSCPVIPDGIILSPLADLGDYAPVNSSCPLLDSRFPISWLDEQGDDWNPAAAAASASPLPNITMSELPDEPEESDNSTLTALTRSSTRRSSATGSSATGLLNNGTSSTNASSTSALSTKSSSTTRLSTTHLSTNAPSTNASSTNALSTKSSSTTRLSTTHLSTNSSSTNAPSTNASSSSASSTTRLSTTRSSTTQLSSARLSTTRLSTNASSTTGSTSNRSNTTGSSTNGSSASRSTTTRSTANRSTTNQPSITSFSTSSKDCKPPDVEGLGKCALVYATKPTFSQLPSAGLSWSCSCQWQYAGQVVTATTKCGTPMCPNWQTTSTRKALTEMDTNPLFTFTDPTPTKTKSDCAWPRNTDFGRCTRKTVELVLGEARESSAPPETAYCYCDGQGTTMVDLVSGCGGSSVCPNQLDLVTDTWPAATQTRCLRGVPNLPFFDSCTLRIDELEHPDLHNPLPGFIPPIIITYCACNNVGEQNAIWKVPVLSSACGGYSCPNSATITARNPEPDTRVIQRATLTTAVRPLIAVTADATPGSILTTSGPTSSPGF